VSSGAEAAVIAGAVSATLGLITLLATGRRTRVDRQRQVFAEAFRAIAIYCEYPFIVRRRHVGEEDRRRITNSLSDVQADLNTHMATLTVEAPRVARAYVELVGATRRTAGAEIRRSWTLPAIALDEQPSITDIDLSAIEPHQHTFLTACADNVSAWPWPARAAGRRIRRVAARPFRWAVRRIRSAGS
jgi:hypothetical protein